MAEIGPVQLVSIGFDRDANFEGKVIDELAKLESERTIRVLDVLFIARDPDSEDTVVLEHPGAENLGGDRGRSARHRVRGRGRSRRPTPVARSTPSDSHERTSRRWPPALARASRPACS